MTSGNVSPQGNNLDEGTEFGSTTVNNSADVVPYVIGEC